jgi:hypothetical protein
MLPVVVPGRLCRRMKGADMLTSSLSRESNSARAGWRAAGLTMTTDRLIPQTGHGCW